MLVVQYPNNKADRHILPRISVDFNTASADMRGRVRLPTHMYPELLNILRLGLRVILFEVRDLEVEAVVEFDKELSQQHGDSNWWFALPDWSTERDYDEKTGQFEKRS